jgi:hypothetical protein
MIGLETILPFQIIYFMFLLTPDKTQIFSLFSYYSASALNFLFYFNGYSFVRSSSFSNSTFNSTNQNFTLAFIICFSYLAFFISSIGFIIRFLSDSESICFEKSEKFIFFWHNRVSLPLFSWFLIPFLILKSTISVSED